jgi:hypothetical protein
MGPTLARKIRRKPERKKGRRALSRAATKKKKEDLETGLAVERRAEVRVERAARMD